MKRRSSSNDTRVRNPYEVKHNWLKGGQCCFWHDKKNAQLYSEKTKQYFDLWAERMQGRIKENLITNNRAEL